MHSCNYKPFHFLWTLQHKSNSPLGPTSFFFSPFLFFPLMFWKGIGPKIRITDKESRFVPCQLKISCRERMQRALSGHQSVEWGWLRDTHLSHADIHPNHHTYWSWTLIYIYIYIMYDWCTACTSVIALPADCCWWLWCWTLSIFVLQ